MRLVAWLLALVALAGCERAADAPAARPALWRASDGDTVIWLLGTIHLLPPDVRWQAGPVRRAIANPDTLITEIPAGDPAAQGAAFLKLARADGLPPLAARVSAAERPVLAEAVAASGVPASTLDRMTSWGAALTLAAGAARGVGATQAAAPEAVLAHAFAGRRHVAFESFAGQLGVFAALSEDDQRRLLAASIRGARDAQAEYDRLLAAWTSGDAAAIERSSAAAFGDAPGLRRSLLTARNIAWADDLKRRAARPGGYLVAVGAAHMVGTDGLPALLSQRGFRVARMQ